MRCDDIFCPDRIKENQAGPDLLYSAPTAKRYDRLLIVTLDFLQVIR